MGERTHKKWRTRRWKSVEALTKTLSQMRDTMQMMVDELDRTDDTVMDVAQKLKGQAVELQKLEENISCIENESEFLSPSEITPQPVSQATNSLIPLTRNSSDWRTDTSVHISTPKTSSYQLQPMHSMALSCMQTHYFIYSPSPSGFRLIPEGARNIIYTQHIVPFTAAINTPPILSSDTVEFIKPPYPNDYSELSSKSLESELMSCGSHSCDGRSLTPTETNAVAKFPAQRSSQTLFALRHTETDAVAKSQSECSWQTSFALTTTSASSSSSSSTSSPSSGSSSRRESARQEELSDSKSSVRETKSSSSRSGSSLTVIPDRAPIPTSTRAPPPSRNESSRATVHDSLAKAVDGGKVDIVKDLLKAGVDVNVYTAGRTPLHRTCTKANVSIVSMLLKYGADCEAKDCYGRSPLHIAAYHDNYGLCITLLIEAGADIFSRTRWGLTPLHYAAQCGNEVTVRALVAAGASNTLKDVKGRTPFDLAKTVCVHRLLRLGTHKNAHSQIIKNPIAKYAPVRLPYTTFPGRGFKRNKRNIPKGLMP